MKCVSSHITDFSLRMVGFNKLLDYTAAMLRCVVYGLRKSQSLFLVVSIASFSPCGVTKKICFQIIYQVQEIPKEYARYHDAMSEWRCMPAEETNKTVINRNKRWGRKPVLSCLVLSVAQE